MYWIPGPSGIGLANSPPELRPKVPWSKRAPHNLQGALTEGTSSTSKALGNLHRKGRKKKRNGGGGWNQRGRHDQQRKRKRGLGRFVLGRPGNTSVAYLVTQNRYLEYGEPRCGVNTKHQRADIAKGPNAIKTSKLDRMRNPRNCPSCPTRAASIRSSTRAASIRSSTVGLCLRPSGGLRGGDFLICKGPL